MSDAELEAVTAAFGRPGGPRSRTGPTRHGIGVTMARPHHHPDPHLRRQVELLAGSGAFRKPRLPGS